MDRLMCVRQGSGNQRRHKENTAMAQPGGSRQRHPGGGMSPEQSASGQDAATILTTPQIKLPTVNSTSSATSASRSV